MQDPQRQGINLDHILETPGLDRRALEAVSLLIGALVLSLLVLIPEQPSVFFAGGAGVTGLTLAFLTTRSTIHATIHARRIWRSHPYNFALK